MERDKLEQKLWDIRISRDKVEILEILAEFDRLKAEVDRYINIAYDYKTERDEAQAGMEQQKSKAESWARGLAHWRNKCIEAQAENERLKVENKEFADVIVQNMAGRRPDFSGLIEADKLREENEKLSTKVATLQSQQIGRAHV